MTRSLRASEDGIKQIRKAMKQGEFTQNDLATALKISRSTITVLLRGEAIDRANFEKLCEFLKLDWRDMVSDDLDLLVQEVKKKIEADVRERCGTMRVLDMTQPVDLERIYTDVNIVKDVIGRRRIGYDEVMEVCTREHFDRFLVGAIQERVTGFAAVEEFKKLVVLGKPGAGKTTFMKYLAMSCLAGKFHGELVPIFVTLKVYAETKGAPTLQEYIFAEMQQREVSSDAVKRLLKEGRALILLDGLDEVKLEDDRRVKRDIDKFSRDWLKNRFVITCRIAAREYQFEQFTEVEVADFDGGQIKAFVNNWFKGKDEPKAAKLLEKLQNNKPVLELAKSPLLLTLLCLVFGDRNDLPPKRSEIYKEGLEIMMKKWDAKRSIEREQIYKHLSPQNKEDMLGQIAFNTSMKGEYFFRQEDLQHQIKDYICQLPEAAADPEALRLDSEAVLKAIEHHHGLLVERARNIYSFSHITFQEYFTAREIDRGRKLEDLMQHITDPRWEEVFLLTAEMLRNASELIRQIKNKIDLQVANNQKLQDFLQWVQEKSSSISYDHFEVRAFYYSLALKLNYDLAEKIDPTSDPNRYSELMLDNALQETLNRATARASLPLSTDLEDAIRMTEDNDLKNKLTELLQLLPTDGNIREWRISEDGRSWLQNLRIIMIAHRNIGQDLDLNWEQKSILKQYYNSNLLLWKCLNISYVDRSFRENITETLLLPVREVERKQENKEK